MKRIDWNGGGARWRARGVVGSSRLDAASPSASAMLGSRWTGTRGTDVGGDSPILRGPSVSYAGTGLPRLMLVSIDRCAGPRAGAGSVYAHREQLEPRLRRLHDEEWRQMVLGRSAPRPADVPWLEPALGVPEVQ